jgi:hypothetical protein
VNGLNIICNRFSQKFTIVLRWASQKSSIDWTECFLSLNYEWKASIFTTQSGASKFGNLSFLLFTTIEEWSPRNKSSYPLNFAIDFLLLKHSCVFHDTAIHGLTKIPDMLLSNTSYRPYYSNSKLRCQYHKPACGVCPPSRCATTQNWYKWRGLVIP